MAGRPKGKGGKSGTSRRRTSGGKKGAPGGRSAGVSRSAKGSGARRKTRSRGKGGKGGGRRAVIIAVLSTVAVGLGLLVLFGERFYRPVSPHPFRTHTEVTLYAADSEGLYLNPRPLLITTGSVKEEIAEAVRLLIEDPSGVVPEGTRLLGVEIKGSTAVLDFSGEIKSNHPGGASAELLTLYSIVNTVALNFRGIRKVQIIIDGRKASTLAGHVDITTPVPPDKKVIREIRGGPRT